MRKAILSLHALEWFLRIFFIVVFFFAINAIINQHANAQVEPFNAEAVLFFHRVLTAPALAVTDDAFADRARLGVFDIGKCADAAVADRFARQYAFPDAPRHLAASIALQDSQGETLCDLRYNSRMYSLLAPQQKAGGIFRKGVNARTFNQPALFQQNGKLQRGTITVTVLQER